MIGPHCLGWVCDGEQVLVRPYGDHPSDLRVRLADGPRPELVTGLLCACLSDSAGHVISEDTVWSWTVRARLQALTGITVATFGRNQVVEVSCSAGDCGALIDIELDLARAVEIDTPKQVNAVLSDGRELILRVPTGLDQHQWLAWEPSRFPEAEHLVISLVESIDGQSPPGELALGADDIETIETVLADADPLTDLQLETACPECGASVRVGLDLEEDLLHRLWRRNSRLLDEIHLLALAYHWSEKEIFALPSDRRYSYLQRIERGAW